MAVGPDGPLAANDLDSSIFAKRKDGHVCRSQALERYAHGFSDWPGNVPSLTWWHRMKMPDRVPRNSAPAVFVEKLLNCKGKRKLVTVRVFAPRKKRKLFECRYEIWIGLEKTRDSVVTGGDAVHSLLQALWKIEIELKHREPFNGMGIQSESVAGFGFIHDKRVWDSVYR